MRIDSKELLLKINEELKTFDSMQLKAMPISERMYIEGKIVGLKYVENLIKEQCKAR